MANLPGISLISFLLGGDTGLVPGREFQRVVPTDAVLCLSDEGSDQRSQEWKDGSEGLCLKWTKPQFQDTWGPLLQEWANAQMLVITGAASEARTLMGSHTRGSQLPEKSWEPTPQPSQRLDLAACVIDCLCFLTKGVDSLMIRAVGGEGSGLNRDVPLPPSSSGYAWERASVLSSQKRYLSKRKLCSSKS